MQPPVETTAPIHLLSRDKGRDGGIPIGPSLILCGLFSVAIWIFTAISAARAATWAAGIILKLARQG